MSITLDKGRIKLNIGRLKQLRKERGLSQERLANTCIEQRLRVSLSSIKRAECGEKVLYRTAGELAQLYEIPITELFDEHSEAERPSFSTEENTFNLSKLKPTGMPVSFQSHFSPKRTTSNIPKANSLLVAAEFNDENDAKTALAQAGYITEHHDYSNNCLRLLINPQSMGVTADFHLIPLCLVFQRFANQQTRLFIQTVDKIDPFKNHTSNDKNIFDTIEDSEWKKIRSLLSDLDWGKVIIQNKMLSLVL